MTTRIRFDKPTRQPADTRPVVTVMNGKYKGCKVRLLRRGTNGWFTKVIDTGEEVYIFKEEMEHKPVKRKADKTAAQERVRS